MNDNIKPKHYQRGKIDLIESWYQQYPIEEFRAIMKSHVNKYVHRYDLKNKQEDLYKAKEYIDRLIDYESKHLTDTFESMGRGRNEVW